MNKMIKKYLIICLLSITVFCLGLGSVSTVYAVSETTEVTTTEEVTTTTVTTEAVTTAETTDEIVPPTGYAGAEDTSLYSDNMLSNATFDLPLFAKNYSTDVWYYMNSSQGVKAQLVDDYAHSGETSVKLSGRTSNYSELQSRSLMIYTQQVYRLSGYVSSLLPTKGNISIRAWGYWDFYTDINEPQRYMNATYYGEVADFKEIGPNSWQYFEVDFSWIYDIEENQLVLYIYDKETGEVNHTLRTTECTDLSIFEFSFMTDPSDENSLTDLYFDSYYLRNVNNEYVDDEENPNPVTTTEPDDNPIIVTPTTEAPNVDDSSNPLVPILSAVSGVVVIAAGVILFIVLKKKK
ncbi:MAG: hypothetical protein PHW40_08195 [Candidatus Izemoplasmatales bacterium]|nr:hypothetical protein [Candidatus Izemoplasmatales bacterium]